MSDKGPTTNQTQSSTTQPWAAAQPQLQSLLSSLGGVNNGVTPGQTTAAQNLISGTSGLGNFAPNAANSASTLFGGGGANNQAPVLQGAYAGLQNSLGGLAQPGNLNPYNTPGFSDALRTMNSDVSNQVNDRFAAAGRDLSPGNSTALARGLSQGEGGLIQQQYNANAGNLQNAATAIFQGGNTTAGGLTGFNQLGNQNMLAGAGLAGAIPGLAMAPGQAQLGAANTQQGLPLHNLGGYESLLTPLAQLGSQSQGQSTTQTSTPLWQQLAGLGIAGAGMFGGNPAGMLSGGQSLMGMLGGNPGGQNSSYMPGGSYNGAQPSFQNGQWGPMYAEGGRPPVGKPAIVGERGPEVFVPDQPGTIIPNNMLQGQAPPQAPPPPRPFAWPPHIPGWF